jgi:hypothetical protein
MLAPDHIDVIGVLKRIGIEEGRGAGAAADVKVAADACLDDVLIGSDDIDAELRRIN